jgi:hypothetical protein
MSHQEKPIYLYHAMLLLLHPDADHCVEERPIPQDLLMASVDVPTLRLPDYVHDIHTGASDKVGACG